MPFFAVVIYKNIRYFKFNTEVSVAHISWLRTAMDSLAYP
jgi:hypothetical protein